MRKYFLWWVVRPSEQYGGHWYGPRYLSDYEAFQEQLAIYKGTSDVSEIHRWFWTPPMPTWEYDTRPSAELIKSSVQFSWL